MNTPSQVTQQIATRAGESSYNATQYLVQGTYRLIIMAPFNTQMGAIPLNPPAGLQFLPDQDPTPYIWNSQIITPANGQYTFLITLDKPVEGSQIYVQFILEAVPPPPPPPPLPPWPPVGGSATGMEQSLLPGCNPDDFTPIGLPNWTVKSSARKGNDGMSIRMPGHSAPTAIPLVHQMVPAARILLRIAGSISALSMNGYAISRGRDRYTRCLRTP